MEEEESDVGGWEDNVLLSSTIHRLHPAMLGDRRTATLTSHGSHPCKMCCRGGGDTSCTGAHQSTL